MTLEARSYYGFYGTAGGYTGERVPNGRRRRVDERKEYRFDYEPDPKHKGEFTFGTSYLTIRAKDYKSALREARKIVGAGKCIIVNAAEQGPGQ